MMDFTKLKKLTMDGVELKQLLINGIQVWKGISYTNQIPISTDTDGSIYNGKGYKENTYLSSSGTPSARSGIVCSGLIPIGYGSASAARGEQVIYMDKITAKATTELRIAFYDSNKNFISIFYGSNMVTESGDNGTAIVVYTLGADGNIVKLDVTGYTAFNHIANDKDTAFFRICAPNIDDNSIITVNEPIE